MVKTKRVYDPVEKSDGERILVTRYWPRPFSKKRLALTEWLRDVAPSAQLLKDWRNGVISWKVYENRYLKEMLEYQAEIKELTLRAKHRTITLLCFEKEEDPCCHRHLLKKLIGRIK